ncbi:type VII toxin-antitoxin system HepT family RNase toxin [Salinibius halmophilus]|uniref:type VII toxin-antitoxin system HepT family RNase toxin n=1 Tax=Salinibius halmophilus TaxID=1853216 RepID=UPI000E670DA9|nr:DUF86 domain-containing protein [Salinibius halmophilus]
MDEAYKAAMQEQVATIAEELAELDAALKEKGYLSSIEYRAAERNLQLIVEACIGITKQTLKTQGVVVPNEARQAFDKLKSLGQDATDIPWTKVVGMRNALVHDYLNLDRQRIVAVIKQGFHRPLIEFAVDKLK